jgi:peptidoglycan/LPS O-acetylase OafA/YrhL
MQRFLIITANCALLALLLIGLPAATHMQLGDWQIASISTGRRLLFWGLAIGAVGNILAGLALVKGRKDRKLCWEWTAVFAGLLLACWGFQRGYFNFNWLKQILLWLQNHF